MEKLNASKIIKFRKLSNKSKITFVNNLKKPAVKTSGGGNYWVRSISAITNACRENNNDLIRQKIESLNEDLRSTNRQQTRNQYQKNLDILNHYFKYNFKKLKPKGVTEIENVKIQKLELNLTGLTVQVLPSYVFKYKNGTTNEVGSVWFVATVNGYEDNELQIFSELLHKYLKKRFIKKENINSEFCRIIDVSSKREFEHTKIGKGKGTSILDITINEIRSLI